ncbi:hypothetical protein Tco_0838649 [Tanacetum coccineum]|uniref:Uncharacterized protein n=1 Tax=Tanacetum coccineum TaxID=301880 RepID=A0ABQ5AQZ1_9ASTR
MPHRSSPSVSLEKRPPKSYINVTVVPLEDTMGLPQLQEKFMKLDFTGLTSFAMHESLSIRVTHVKELATFLQGIRHLEDTSRCGVEMATEVVMAADAMEMKVGMMEVVSAVAGSRRSGAGYFERRGEMRWGLGSYLPLPRRKRWEIVYLWTRELGDLEREHLTQRGNCRCDERSVANGCMVMRLLLLAIEAIYTRIELSRWSEFGISSWRGSRVDGRSYLLSGAIDDSEANRIICDSKSEFENSLETLKFAAMPFGLTNAPALQGVNEPGGVRVAREDDRGVTEGREDVREVFQQRRSGAKRKLSRCGRNQLGNEPILALPEGADDFVVYYDARSKDLEACLEKKGRSEFDFEAKYHLGKANVDVVPSSMKKNIASCGSKYLACSRVEIEYQWSSRLLLQPELPRRVWWMLEIDGEDLEDVGITVNRSDGDISEEVECTNTERHDDYDALNLFRLLLKSIDDHVLADTLWEYGLSKLLLFTDLTIRGRVAVGLNPNIRLYRYKGESHTRNGPVSSPWSQVYILHESRNVAKDAYSKISKLYTVCEKVNPNLERSSKALENAFWLLSQKLAEED